MLTPFDGQDGGGSCKWIEANYGNGKTQFLRCMQELAWDLRYVPSFVELSQDECPLDRPDRIYGAVARAVQATPSSKGESTSPCPELLDFDVSGRTQRGA